jgi:hypothetical protein
MLPTSLVFARFQAMHDRKHCSARVLLHSLRVPVRLQHGRARSSVLMEEACEGSLHGSTDTHTL